MEYSTIDWSVVTGFEEINLGGGGEVVGTPQHLQTMLERQDQFLKLKQTRMDMQSMSTYQPRQMRI